MKLYEFTITDNNKLTGQELDQLVQEILKTESQQQCWVPGYQCSPVGVVNTLEDGSKQYRFQVNGNFQSATFPDEAVRNSDANLAPEAVAARPLDL